MLADAAAFIWTGHTDGVGPFTGAVGFNCWGRISAVMVSKETGLLLQRLIHRHGSVEAEIESADTHELKTSWNIIGDIGGEHSGSDEMVVIGNHYDGHDIAQGAHDPKSGLVAMLEMARVLAQRANPIKRKLRFICLGVEELGLIGAHAYVDTHADDIAETRLMLNMDAAGGPGAKGLTLFGQDINDHLASLTASMTDEVCIDVSVPEPEEPGHLFADHFPFMAQGIPCGFVREPESGVIITAYYHTKADTVDKLRAHDMQELAFLGARLAWRAANDDSWSDVRPNAAEVAKTRAEYDRNQISRQIEASSSPEATWRGHSTPFRTPPSGCAPATTASCAAPVCIGWSGEISGCGCQHIAILRLLTGAEVSEVIAWGSPEEALKSEADEGLTINGLFRLSNGLS